MDDGKMDFRPVNSDHAIESATFGARVSFLIDDAAIFQLQAKLGQFRELLPYVNVQQVTIFDATGPVATPHASLMLNASMMRADGTAVWNLRISGYEIVVTCTRYSRWERIWSQARDLIMFAFAELSLLRPDVEISHVALTVTDKFLTETTSYDLAQLLKSNEFVAPFAYRSGPKWHSHTGWFQRLANPLDEIEVLNQLNLDARTETSFDAPDQSVSVTIVHTQQADVQKASKETELLDNGQRAWQRLDPTMRAMHMCNKAVLQNMLADQLVATIGLKGQSNG